MTCYLAECHYADPCDQCGRIFGQPLKYYEEMSSGNAKLKILKKLEKKSNLQ